MGAISALFENLGPFRWRFRLVFLAGLLDGAVIFFIPALLARFASGGISLQRAEQLTFLLIAAYGSSLLLQYILRRIGESLTSQYALHLRERYYARLGELPVNTLKEHHSGYLLSLIGTVSDGLAGLTNELFWGVSKSISTLLLFFYLSAQESLALAVGNLFLLVLFVSLSTALSWRMVPLASELNETRARFFERYADLLANIITVRRLSLESFAKERLEERISSTTDQIKRFQRFHAGRWFLLHFLFGLAFIGTIVFLVFRAARGEGETSSLILFVGAYAIIRGLVERLSEDWKTVIEQNAYLKALHEVLDVGEVRGAEPAEWQTISISQGVIRYPDREFELSYPHFRISRGESILIQGVSGEGKSTLLQILAGDLPLLRGELLVDGQAEISPRFFNQRAALLSQEAELFSLSIRENINLSRKLSDEEILRAADRIGLGDWLREVGLDAFVGEKGVKISGGQKQRINLLRALSLEREILLLDEPTAHLDKVTEARVVEFLREILKGRTAVIVSHREALQSLCSRRYVMEGQVLGHGEEAF